jgi:hypothetical protein
LEICFHYPHRFLDPDYSVFDCSGVVFSEANLKALGSRLFPTCLVNARTQLSGGFQPRAGGWVSNWEIVENFPLYALALPCGANRI